MWCDGICEPVYSECRIACDAATPCPQGLECLEEGFCFDLSGSSAAIACNADGACDDAAYTCFVESQCLMQCVDDSDCGADEFCNDESFVCEWNGGGSGWDCAANEVQCEEPDGTISCHPEGHDCGGETVGSNCDAANPVACEEADGSVTCHPEGHNCGGETAGQNCDAANPVACEGPDGVVTCHPEGHDCGGDNPNNTNSVCTNATEPVVCGSSGGDYSCHAEGFDCTSLEPDYVSNCLVVYRASDSAPAGSGGNNLNWNDSSEWPNSFGLRADYLAAHPSATLEVIDFEDVALGNFAGSASTHPLRG